MKKIISTYLLLFLLTNYYSQDNITINGQVIFVTENQVFFENVSVFLRLNDTSFLAAKTNKNGEFKFQFKRANKQVIVCHESLKRLPDGTTQPCGYLSCNGLPSTSTETINLTTDTIYTVRLAYPWNIKGYCDFSCYNSPEIYFKTNSISTVRDKNLVIFTQLPADSIVSEIKNIIQKNPKFNIEISGHCDSRELDAKNLSLKRAKLIKDQLIKSGISDSRIIIKGYGATQLLVSTNQITSEKDKSKKEDLMQKNRRVNIKLVSSTK